MSLTQPTTSPTTAVKARRQVTDVGRGPEDFDVLVLDGSCKQSLASVRSLGRRGLRVAVGECFAECDPTLPVLAFRSRYASRTVVLPSYATDPLAFGGAVLDFVRANPTRVVLPTMDGSIKALMQFREQFEQVGTVLALPSNEALEIANDKAQTLEIARKLGIAVPRTMRIDSIDEVRAMLADFEFPIVLKPSTSWAPHSIVRLQSAEAVNESEALRITQELLAAGASILAQEYACGRREGVTMLMAKGEVRAHCAHVAHRTSPALGGASVMRESLPVPAEVYQAAAELVTAIGLEGVCEVEFRRDAKNRPLLMEINARLAGTIENAVRSGVDFPLLVWQWATGSPVDRVDSYATGVRTRWLHGDMRWLRDNYHRVGRPDSVSRLRSQWMFAAEFFKTRHYDCLDLHDLGPAKAELRTTVAALWQSTKQRSAAVDTNRHGAQIGN
jgi:predicted ATP-grasp superfamily ATP-dependent carboligase